MVLYQSRTLNTALQVYRRPTGIVAWGREMWARVTRQVPTRNRALGSSVGSWDPNPEFTPDQLYGVRDKVGLLERTRKTHPILAPALDSRAEFIVALDYRIVPRRDTPEAAAAAVGVARALAACETHDLPSLIAAVYESLMTFGHSVVAVDNTAALRLTVVHPSMIQRFDVEQPAGSVLTGVQIYDLAQPLDPKATGVVSRSSWVGQFRGDSVLRPMLATQAVEEKLIQGVLRALAASTGVPVAKIGGGVGPISADEAEEVDELLTLLVTGDSGIARVRDRHEIEWIASPGQALTQFGPVMTLFDARTRAAVGASLANLGITKAGNRALGEVVSDADETQLRRHLEATLRLISGTVPQVSSLMGRLAEACGYDWRDAPKIEIAWESNAEATLDHCRLVGELAGQSMLDADEARRFLAANLLRV